MNSWKNRTFQSDWLLYVLLVIAYLVISVPHVLGITQFHKLIFPLNFIYFSETLFSGMQVNPEIAHTLISPAHANLIYPPGIYMLTSVLGSVKNMFNFLLVVQVVVPLVTFSVIRRFAPSAIAFSVAILLAYYCTSVDTWYPDFIIQPLMMLVVSLLMTTGELRFKQIIMLAVTTGLIIILKHNIGIFLAILCGTVIFFNSIQFKADDSKNNWKILAYVIFSGFALFGFIFAFRLPGWVDRTLFLGPYFIFWLYVFNLFRNDIVELEGKKFLSNGARYAMWSLVIPLCLFVYFGSVIGFKRYFYSLFGMGLDYLGFWNHGVVELVRGYIKTGGYGQLYVSMIAALIILGPFIVNVCVVLNLYIRGLRYEEGHDDLLRQLKIISIGIMAVFLLFPLEDIKIAQTKFFIFVFVSAAMLSGISFKKWRLISSVLICMLLPVAMVSYSSMVNIKQELKQTVSMTERNNKIQMPVNTELEHEMNVQASILKGAVNGQGYFVFTSAKYNLLWLSAMFGNSYLQNYVRFDDEVMNEKVADVAISELRKINYVVETVGDYEDYVNGDLKSPAFSKVMAFIDQNFTVVNQYIKPSKDTPAILHIDSFRVLRKRSELNG